MSYDGRVGAMAATLPVDLTLSVLPVLRLTAGAHRPTTKTTHRQTYTKTYRQTDAGAHRPTTETKTTHRQTYTMD